MKPRKRDSVQSPSEGYTFNNEIQTSLSLNRLIIFRPAIIIGYNPDWFGIFGWEPRWRSRVLFLSGNVQMSDNLEVSHTGLSLDHRLLIYETDDTHFAFTLKASEGIDLPDKLRLRTFLMHSRHISCSIRFGL